MNILTLIYIQLGINILLLSAVVYYGYLIAKYRKYLPVIMNAAHHALEDPAPVDPRLIEEWKARRNSLPEGSTDWLAYSRKLVEAGLLREV